MVHEFEGLEYVRQLELRTLEEGLHVLEGLARDHTQVPELGKRRAEESALRYRTLNLF